LTKVFDRKWFVLRNFHCQWFEDSHILNEYLHHQQEGLSESLKKMGDTLPALFKLGAKLLLPSVMKQLMFAPMAKNNPASPLYWVEHENHYRVAAFYGSRDAYENIPDWGTNLPEAPSWSHYQRLDHGYDETKPVSELELNDMIRAAKFRGGECLSPKMSRGDLFSPLRWKCAFGHEFDATPNLVLKGGHWCPHCSTPPWNYDEEARRNPFFAQVWYANHTQAEENVYPRTCIYDLRGAAD
jgi:hypothetical protein